ncbi:MAG: biopolymer transporter ExbD [Spirochaetales bacterium]|nr:biopolymer transporter ExbD [Spirochaetales bacterium]
MNIRKTRKKRIDIADSGALSDLAFLLIVFFIVIAVFNINKGFILELPKKDSQKIVNIDDIMKVWIAADGSISANGESLDMEELERRTKDMIALRPNATFLLHIHPDAEYQDVVDIIDMVRLTEVENFSFAMKDGGAQQ